MAAPIQLSDEELYQQLGSWEAAAAARDAQNNALNEYNLTRSASEAPASNVAAPNIDNLVNQIIGQNLTGRWSGEGFGSAQANAADMAKILADIGITDINQFGKVTKTIPGYSVQTEQGEEYVPEQKIDTYVNKVTGQEVGNTYGERQSGNFFGGTYAGKGNTGYGVQFDAKGNPYFYTSGASSNDIVNFLGDDPILNAVAQIGATYFGGPLGSAALNAAMGKDVKDIAKSYVMSQLGQEAFKGLTDTGVESNLFGETGANLATDIKDLFGKTGSEVIGKTAGQYVARGGNVDIGDLLVNQGVGTATNAVLGEIPGFDGLNAAEKRFVTNIVSSTLNDGKLSTNEAVNAALSAGTQAMKSASKSSNLKSGLAGFDANSEDFIEGYFQPGGAGYMGLNGDEMTVREDPENLDAFLRELSPYQVDGGTSVFAQDEDVPEMETVSKRPITSLADLFGDTDIMQTVDADVPELFVKDSRPKTDVPEMVITDERPVEGPNSLRTKEIVSDIPDEVITADQIDKLFPDLKIDDILQTVTPPGTKTVTPPAKKTTTPGTQTTQQSLANLGLNAPMPSQDPYANIKLMEELFGGDTAYKLRALGAPKNLASADIDALARMLRG